MNWKAMKIVAAAIRKDGQNYTLPPPARHHTILHMMAEAGVMQDGHTDQGFLTDTGDFVRRKPAAMIARHAGQIGEVKKTDPQHTLFSEDLW